MKTGMMKTTMKLTLALLALSLALAAQVPHPTCDHCRATYIPKSEFDAYTARAIKHHLVDQEVRSIDIGKARVGIGMVTRGRLVPGARQGGRPVAEHEQVSEIYYVISGSATLLTGPDLVDPKQRPATMRTVRLQNGPGFGAASIKNPVTHHLKAGDVVVIPAGVGHWFTRVDHQITYLMVRVDPDKVVPLMDAAQSKAYLATPVKPRAR